VAGGYTRERADAVLASGDVDLVAFGKLFIANPICLPASSTAGPQHARARHLLRRRRPWLHRLPHPTATEEQPA
jgi:2,4-dienoyl-CoA reductase-like NADH-dependent reductase (Old Yellow Enzyme family)